MIQLTNSPLGVKLQSLTGQTLLFYYGVKLQSFTHSLVKHCCFTIQNKTNYDKHHKTVRLHFSCHSECDRFILMTSVKVKHQLFINYNQSQAKNKYCHMRVYVSMMVFNASQQYLSYIVAVSSIGVRNWSTQRKPPTCRKSLTNFIT